MYGLHSDQGNKILFFTLYCCSFIVRSGTMYKWIFPLNVKVYIEIFSFVNSKHISSMPRYFVNVNSCRDVQASTNKGDWRR